MDAPNRQRKAQLFKRLVPREYVLIDTVDEGAIEIEEKGRSMGRVLSHGSISPEKEPHCGSGPNNGCELSETENANSPSQHAAKIHIT
jgi:hypothetical protein